ncbi:hypothetical protein niasHS_010307 [Heterodera schachtii]|uniref:Uncharacterized protein n=1 Tax=Heterodera schachtii TaxID=97005 RepID=A0ABD2J652_HETSC
MIVAQNNKNNGIGAGSPSSGPTLEELLVEELSQPLESERSFVHISHFCYILLPFDEPRPYLSALLTDDADQTVDDEQHNDDYFARILSRYGRGCGGRRSDGRGRRRRTKFDGGDGIVKKETKAKKNCSTNELS